MSTCTTCKHYREPDKCAHPNVTHDPVSGGTRLRIADRMRESDGPCGPEGRLWFGRGVADPPLPEAPQQGPFEPPAPLAMQG